MIVSYIKSNCICALMCIGVQSIALQEGKPTNPFCTDEKELSYGGRDASLFHLKQIYLEVNNSMELTEEKRVSF